MEREFQIIDGKTLKFDKDTIKRVFGVAGEVIESTAIYFGKTHYKFAFYNTGELCEVSYVQGGAILRTQCYGNRAVDVLHWLMVNLAATMGADGWETHIVPCENCFNTLFYKPEK